MMTAPDWKARRAERDQRLLQALRAQAAHYPAGHELLRSEILRTYEELFPDVRDGLKRLEGAGLIAWRREGRFSRPGYRLLFPSGERGRRVSRPA